MAINCWEFNKCGREVNGISVDEAGVCQATTCKEVDGVNHGKNAGRTCWLIVGSLSGDNALCSCVKVIGDCRICDFYKQVHIEEGSMISSPLTVLSKLKFKQCDTKK